MATLAIKGHKTRGKEVLAILEMLGGERFYYYTGTDQQCYYTIINGKITLDCPQEKYKVFSLEEFLEKFPYKVGDKVMIVRSKNTYIISQMIWNGNEVVYALSFSGNNICWFTANELQPFEDDWHKAVFEANEHACNISLNITKEGNTGNGITYDEFENSPQEVELKLINQ